MLRQRVITAVLLLAVLVPAMMASVAWPFAVLTCLFIGAAGWEWGRLTQCTPTGALAMGGVVGLLCAGAAWAGPGLSVPVALWWAVALAWGGIGVWALRGGPSAWPRVPLPLRQFAGAALLVVAWLALNTGHGLGLNFLLSMLCLVWMADIAAYFGGRRFGRRKLAPAISPGKSWEGVWSGLAGVLTLAALWVWADRHFGAASPSLYSVLLERRGALGAALAVLALSALSVAGDLVESLTKRAAGVKDSSQLLPGHGGVLDRIDALLPVLPAAMAFALG